MNNNHISQKQGICMIAMFIMGTSSILVMAVSAKMDTWIAILLAGGVSALLVLIFTRLISILPDKDFYQMLKFFFGKVGSKVIIFIFTWFAFDNCALVVRNYSQFIVTVGLKETPLIVIMFIVTILCAISVRSGIEVLGRWTEPFILFVISFIIISVLLVSQNMKITNILPVFDNGIAPIVKGSLNVITFPFTETVIFLLVFPAFKKGVSIKKIFLKGLLIGGSIIFIVSLTDMLVLGSSISENVYYSTFTAMSTVHYGDLFQRMEFITAIVFIISAFFKLSIYLLGVCKGTANLLGFKDYRFIVIPITFLVINVAFFSFDSIIYYHEWNFKVWPYYAPIYQVIIPLVLLITIEIKRKKKKRVTN